MVLDIQPPIGAVVTLARIPWGIAGLILACESARWGPGLKLSQCSKTAFLYMFSHKSKE